MKQTIKLPDSIAPEAVTWLQLTGADVSDQEYWEAIEWEKREQWKRFMFDEEFLGYIFNETSMAPPAIKITPLPVSKPEKRIHYHKTSWQASHTSPAFQYRYSSVKSPLELLSLVLADSLLALHPHCQPSAPFLKKVTLRHVPVATEVSSFRLILDTAEDMKPMRYYEPPERGAAISINERYYQQRYNNSDGSICITFAGINSSDFMMELFAAAHRLPDIRDVAYDIRHHEVFDCHRIIIKATLPYDLPKKEARAIRSVLKSLSELIEAAGTAMLQRSLTLEDAPCADAQQLPAALIPFPTPIADSDSSEHAHKPLAWE